MLPPSAVLDANVLFPASLRDLLLRCAEKGLYRLQISHQIWDEVRRNLVGTGRLTPQQVARLDRAIQAFLGGVHAFVEGYESVIPTLTNHPKDRHVLAVAIYAGIQTIVTFNMKDFPVAALQPYGIVAERPDTFLLRLQRLDPALMLHIAREQATALRNPPLTLDDVLSTLALHVPAFVDLLRSTMSGP